MDAQPDQAGQLLLGLDTLGHDATAHLVGKGEQRLDKRPLDRIVVQAVHEGHVELHEIRLDLGDGSEPRIPRAHVIHGHAVAGGPVVVESAVEHFEIVYVMPIGDLQHHTARLQAVLVEEASGLARGEGRIKERAGMDVAKKPAALVGTGKTLDGRLPADLFQGENGPGLLGEIEEHGRGFERTAGRPPGQGLVGEDLAAAQGDDGLVHGPHLAEFEDSPKFPQDGEEPRPPLRARREASARAAVRA